MKELFLRNVRIILILLVIHLCCIKVAISEEIIEIIEPNDLLNVFYDNLISDKPFNDCDEIFYDPQEMASTISAVTLKNAPKDLTASGKIWYYFRKNKPLFLFPNILPELTVEEASMDYKFSGFGKRQLFFDGFFGIILGSPLPVKRGVRKEISFYFEKNDKPYGYRYLINPFTISINGIYLDKRNEADRSGDLYEQLGFRNRGTE